MLLVAQYKTSIIVVYCGKYRVGQYNKYRVLNLGIRHRVMSAVQYQKTSSSAVPANPIGSIQEYNGLQNQMFMICCSRNVTVCESRKTV